MDPLDRVISLILNCLQIEPLMSRTISTIKVSVNSVTQPLVVRSYFFFKRSEWSIQFTVIQVMNFLQVFSNNCCVIFTSPLSEDETTFFFFFKFFQLESVQIQQSATVIILSLLLPQFDLLLFLLHK